MKQILLLCFLFFCGLFSLGVAAQEQLIQNRINVSSGSKDVKERLTENEIRIHLLEEELKKRDELIEKEKLEFSARLEEKFNTLENSLQIQKENLEFREKLVDRWLTILSILVTFFGIAVPILGIKYGKEVLDDVKNQEYKIKGLIIDSEKLKKTIESSEKDLKSMEERSRNLRDVMRASSNRISWPDKQEMISLAYSIFEEEGSTPYQKDVAKAYWLSLMGRYSEAVFEFERIVRWYSNHMPGSELFDLYSEMGYVFNQLNQFSDAVIFYRKAIGVNGGNQRTWMNLGLNYQELEKNEEALECFRKVISLEKDDSISLNDLGSAYSKLGNYKNAIKYYNAAILNEKDNLELDYAYLGLIEALIFNNQIDEAEELLRRNARRVEGLAFDYLYLNTLIKLIKYKENLDENDVFEKMKASVYNDSNSIVWSPFDLKHWLSSESSYFISNAQRSFLYRLIEMLKEWINK